MTFHPFCSTACLFLTCCIAAGVRITPICAQEQRRDTRTASTDRGDTLARFVDELVSVTPGKNGFPTTVSLPSRELCLSHGIRIACYETTQEVYQVVMGMNPSRWRGPRNSVESVSRQDVDRFCDLLTKMLQQENLIGQTDVVRLPTAAEWEYCCRAGSVEPFYFGRLDDSTELLDKHAWHTGNAAGNDPAVGVLLPNAYGLYDVHGYLWEFVNVDDGANATPGTAWVMGGSWRDSAPRLASDSKKKVPLSATSDAIGFRCVVVAAPSNSKNVSDQ
ncbi:MAG: SUMF1/EgtB/PvdO family nonheme iron enzyme [Fuerstiella sp.]|nr:SUMF1/EgtB/PvdO family nonheme iron enzyme [Fuerstiella sp.]